MRIGFLGLGKMGTPMALRLIAAGHELSVWNRTEGRTKPLLREGAIAAATPAEAELGADAVITMLFDDAAHEEVLFGANGLMDALEPGALHISCSTISVALSESFVFAQSQGVEPEVFFDTVNSALFQSPFYAAYGKVMLHPSTQPGATIDLGAKDVRLLREAARSRGARLSLADTLAEIFAEAQRAGLGGEDWAVGQFLMAERRGKTEG